MYRAFRGVTTEMMTAYFSDGTIDTQSFFNNSKFQLDNGIKGLFVNGIGGESIILPNAEKANQAAIAMSAVKGNIPVFGNIMVHSIEEALDLIDKYDAVGIDGMFLAPPNFYVHTEDGLYEYYSTILKATKKPIGIYNAPETKNKIPSQLIGRLVDENENVTAYKDSTIDILHLEETISYIKRSPFDILAGSDSTIYPTLCLGGHGIISFITLAFPKFIIALQNAFDRGDYEAARKIQFDVLKLRKVLKKCPRTSGYMYATELVGVPLRGSKLPKGMMTLSDENKRALDDVFGELNLI